MSSSANWQIKIRDIVYKQLAKFPRKDRERILKEIEDLPKNPFAGDIQKMEGEDNVWRRRVGAYRIRYEIITSEKVIYVFRAERRTSHTC